jgi:hypothetical protein
MHDHGGIVPPKISEFDAISVPVGKETSEWPEFMERLGVERLIGPI